jgi:ESCRT-II complex subunit VPS25
MDKGHKKCLILWLRIQDWSNLIFNFVILFPLLMNI